VLTTFDLACQVIASRAGGASAQLDHLPPPDTDDHFRRVGKPCLKGSAGIEPPRMEASGTRRFRRSPAGTTSSPVSASKTNNLLYLDLEDVERWTGQAEQGRFELFRLPGYLCGMPSYVLVGEAATARVLEGSLAQPSLREPLAERGRRSGSGKRSSPCASPDPMHRAATCSMHRARSPLLRWPRLACFG
jgi:hypothetical protein